MYDIEVFDESHILEILAIAPEFVKHYRHIEYNEESILHTLNLVNESGVGFVAKYEGSVVGLILGFVTTPLWDRNEILQEVAWWVNNDHRGTSVGVRLLKTFEMASKGRRVVMSILPHTNIKEHTMTKLGYIKAEESYIQKE